MKYPYTSRKATGESLYSLWCEGNLGDEADTSLAHSDNLGQGAQVNLSFAAAGNSEEEEN
ncbi:unnamed protein product [marine sediment metagenome]|uniref:Uncharacterized protein n=1 Tax=marine sediment metagenome TaxID=412755 RepID=X1M4W6_9ZZZZ